MQPPLTVTVANPRSASSRRTETASGLSTSVAVRGRLVDHRPEDRQRARRRPRPAALRRTPAQRRHRLAPLALGARAVLGIKSAFRPRHHDVPFPEILLVERAEA